MFTSLADGVTKSLPAVRLRHFARIALVEAHAGQHEAAGGLDARGDAKTVGVRLDLRTGHHKQRDRCATAIQQVRDLAKLNQAELRRGEDHNVDLVESAR